MSNTVKYTIEPKIIDSSGNERELDSYTVAQVYTKKEESFLIMPNADKYITLPVIADQKLIEFQSDADVYFAILISGTKTIEFTACRNLILRIQNDYTFEIKNISGDDAEITWRVFS